MISHLTATMCYNYFKNLFLEINKCLTMSERVKFVHRRSSPINSISHRQITIKRMFLPLFQTEGQVQCICQFLKALKNTTSHQAMAIVAKRQHTSRGYSYLFT